MPPYPFNHCANVDCEVPLVTADDAAYLYMDLASGKMCMFCDDCARHAELNHGERFKLIPL